jgi:hypothetical protein
MALVSVAFGWIWVGTNDKWNLNDRQIDDPKKKMGLCGNIHVPLFEYIPFSDA